MPPFKSHYLSTRYFNPSIPSDIIGLKLRSRVKTCVASAILKIPFFSKAVFDKHWPIFCSILSAVMTSWFEWNTLEGCKTTTNKQTNKFNICMKIVGYTFSLQADIGTDSPYHLSPKDPGFRGCTSRKSKLFDVDCYVNHAVCVYRNKTCQWKGKFRKKHRGK